MKTMQYFWILTYFIYVPSMGKYIVIKNFPVTPKSNFNTLKLSSSKSPISKAPMKNTHETITNVYIPFLRVIFRTCDDKNILYFVSSKKFEPIEEYTVIILIKWFQGRIVRRFLSEAILMGPSRIKFNNIVIYKQQCILSALIWFKHKIYEKAVVSGIYCSLKIEKTIIC